MTARRTPRAGVVYTGQQDLQSVFGARPGEILGGVGYGGAGGAPLPVDVPFAWTGLDTLGGGQRFELWLSPAPVTLAQANKIRFAYSDEVLFGCLDFEVPLGADFQTTAFEHYCHVFDLLDARGFPHLLRAWHYVPDIHRDDDGLERYKRFSLARHEAFVAKGRDIGQNAPAASAVGSRASRTVIFFLSGTQPGTPITNPRQVNAYEYPLQYGPRAPTFARALHTRWQGMEQLYVSGTASIVGHESRHAGDLARQAEETVQNLRSVFSQAHTLGLPALAAWQDVLFKIYVRDAEAREEVTRRVRGAFGERPELICVQGDICRRELLLEIEAVALQPQQQAA